MIWLDRIAEALLATLAQMTPMTVIGAFSLVLFALFLAALLALVLRRAPAFQMAAPALLTTLGILATFLGVAIGLIDFDVARVEASIPGLLEGLKLAFLTSIVGILLAVTLRLLQVVVPLPEGPGESGSGADAATTGAATGTPAAEVLTLLRQQQGSAQELVTVVRGLDQHLGQQHQTLLASLEGMAERMTEMGSGHLVAALEQVIRDFNSRLGEQFGENFRRLDHSVAQLLEWQERYREQMDTLHRSFDQAREGVEQSERTLERLTGQALRISRHVEDQEDTLASLRRETVELEALLSAIAALREQATQAFPAMDARLEAMLESLENAVAIGQRGPQRWQEPAGALS